MERNKCVHIVKLVGVIIGDFISDAESMRSYTEVQSLSKKSNKGQWHFLSQTFLKGEHTHLYVQYRI